MIPLKDDQPSLSPPVITILLILLNIAVYIYMFFIAPNVQEVVKQYALFPNQVFGLTRIFKDVKNWQFHWNYFNPNVIGDFFTSMFMHGSLMHIIGNMWFLWIFGDNVEDVMGKFQFTFFYLISGLFAAFVHSMVTAAPQMPIVGASGAIAGVMGAYLALYPRARIYSFVPLFFIWVIPVPAFIFLIIWFGGQLLNGYIELLKINGTNQIAFWAHIGGFIFGFVTGLFYRKNLQRS